MFRRDRRGQVRSGGSRIGRWIMEFILFEIARRVIRRILRRIFGD